RGINLCEQLEDARDILGIESDSTVPDADQGMVAAALESDRDRASALHVLAGVAEQIAENLYQAVRVRQNIERLGLGLRGQLVTGVRDQGARAVERLFDNRAQFDALLLQFDLS